MVRPDTVEDLELPPGRLEPLDRVPIQNDRQFPLGVGVELLHGIEAPLESAEEIFRHVALVFRRMPEIERLLTGNGAVIAGLKLREALADLHFIADGFLPV